jgi:hypothetical protein
MKILRGVRGLWRLGLVALLGGAASTGCATTFTGDAHVPGGPAGCRDVCGAYGMDLAGMVAMGEYSDGCICKVRGQAASGDGSALAVAGAAPASVGVIMAMRARAQQQHY